MAGMFSRSSRDVELRNDGKVHASCRRSDGEWVPAMIDLNFYLSNLNGIVQFVGQAQRPGNFLASSAGVTLTGTTLSGTARRINQTSVAFNLDLDRNVANIEGRLLWLVIPSEPYNSPDNDDGGFGSYDVSTDQAMIDYAHSLEPNRPKREVNITPPTRNDRQDIQNLVRLWDLDLMDRNLGQATMVEFPRRPQSGQYTPHRQGWRIDNQENGSFPVHGLQYYSLAVQNGSAVYANILVPVRYRVGRTRIRHAFLRSMDEGRIVTIDPPPGNPPSLPGQDDPRAENLFVQSLSWVVLVGLAICLL